MYKDKDVFFARQYLLNAVSRRSFWKGYNFENKQKAVEELNSINTEPSTLNQWIEDWLTPQQKQKMQSAVRSARQRNKGKSVTLTDEAHGILKDLASYYNLTLSEVIVRKLSRAQQRIK